MEKYLQNIFKMIKIKTLSLFSLPKIRRKIKCKKTLLLGPIELEEQVEKVIEKYKKNI